MSSPRPSKRRRIYRACDQCRRRKSKCDGEQPTCAICRSAGRECTYQTGGGRRGLAPGYVRSLEIMLGLAFQNVPNSEATVHGILFDSRASNFFRSKAANTALNTWRKSKPSKGLSQLLSNSDEAPDDLDWEPVEDQDQDEQMHDQPSSQVEVSTEVHPPQPQAPPGPSNPLDAPVPESTPDLLEFYFTYTHPWFPILERRELLRAMHSGPGPSMSEVSSSRILLWAVIVYSSVMRDTRASGLPTPSIIHLFIQQQALSKWQSLELAHVQAILILALIHIATGELCLAWNLVGQATRMISTLPPSAKKNRFSHTFNGSVFLDNILSAALGNTPALSQQEQLAQGPIEEDDVDEWDVWTASRVDSAMAGRKAPAPLRALSTFNSIRQLMSCLSEILYSPTNSINADHTLHKIQDTFRQSHSYNKQTDAYPPILILHLTSTFTTITLLCKVEQISPTTTDLCIKNIHHMLDLLDHYQEIIGTTRPSPLAYCFALQTQTCISRISSTINNAEKESLERRIAKFSQLIPSTILQPTSTSYSQPLIANSIEQDNLLPMIRASTSQAILNEPLTLEAQSDPSAMDISSVAPQGDQMATVPMGIEGYDALFEEMVTSFPSSRYFISQFYRFEICLTSS